MAEQVDKTRIIEGNADPDPMPVKGEIAAARSIIEVRKERIDAIKDFSRGFPILHQLVCFSEGLGWSGVTSKKWRQFSEVVADLMQIGSLLYDWYEKTYDALFGDHTREERIWFVMCDKIRNVVEDVNALVIEMLPELKREIELRAESQERQEFIEGVFRKPDEKKRPTYDEILGEGGNRDKPEY